MFLCDSGIGKHLKGETLRFLGLNERNVSLVVICAVILVMQRLSSEATACPDTRCAKSTKALPKGGYIVFSMITKSSIDVYCT